MAFLSNDSIKYYIYEKSLPPEKKIRITPEISKIQIGQCSIDLELSTQFARFRKSYFSLKTFDLQQKSSTTSIQKNWYKYLTVTENEGIAIKPNEVVIAITKQWVGLPKNMFGFITGRSSFSRMGIEVQLTQNLHQPGHNAQILLQIKNNSPFTIKLYPGMRIAQLMIGLLDKDCNISYDENPNSKYVAGKTGISANWFQDFELRDREFINKSPDAITFIGATFVVLALFTIIYSVIKFIKIGNGFDVPLVIFSILMSMTLVLGVIITYLRNR